MLHAVVDYARTRGMTAEAGFKPKTVRWLLIFSPEGEFRGVHDYEDKANKVKGREFSRCPDLTQPEMVAAGEGCRPFLVDGLDVLIEWNKAEDDEKATAKLAAKHAYFLRWMSDAAIVPELKVIAERLNDSAVCREILQLFQDAKAKPTDLGTIAIQHADELRIIVTENVWHDWWRGVRQQLGSARQTKSSGKSKSGEMRCLLSGELIAPLATHGKISGLSGVGGLAMGDAITSFDKDAFCSFGLEQGANAAMSEEMATTYVAAINRLIKEKSVQLAGTKVLYWYSRELPPEKDIVGDVFDFGGAEVKDDDEPAPAATERSMLQAESRARSLLDSIRTSGDPDDLRHVTYCALTLSGNSGRVMIRDWMEGRFEELAMAIANWQDDLSIGSMDGSRIYSRFPIDRLITAALPPRKPNQKYEDWIRGIGGVRDALWSCAVRLGRRAFSESVIARILRCQHSALYSGEVAESKLSIMDSDAEFAAGSSGMSPRNAAYRWAVRAALLKAFLIRQGDKEVEPYLNVNHPSPAYHAGRYLAVVQHIQALADNTVKANIADRFYASCSTAPGLVISRIWNTARTRLREIERKNPFLARELFRLLVEIHGKFKDSLPTSLSLKEQALFQLGYFQQQPFLRSDINARPAKTVRGEAVRSKSEKIIADELNRKGIAYEYEKSIVLDDVEEERVLPDFTIERTDQSPIYIEHLGLRDRPSYVQKWNGKLRVYREIGILPAEEGGGANGILLTSDESDIADLSNFIERLEKAIAMP